MPALNFRAQYAGPIMAGTKNQTVRRRRADGRDPCEGDTIHLYTGMRTKHCRKLKTVRCTGVKTFKIQDDHLLLDGVEIRSMPALTGFAKLDGFQTWYGLVNFFDETYGLPFEGLVIYWAK